MMIIEGGLKSAKSQELVFSSLQSIVQTTRPLPDHVWDVAI